MLQLNTLVRFIHSHSPARLSKFKKILARRPKSVPTPALKDRNMAVFWDFSKLSRRCVDVYKQSSKFWKNKSSVDRNLSIFESSL